MIGSSLLMQGTQKKQKNNTFDDLNEQHKHSFFFLSFCGCTKTQTTSSLISLLVRVTRTGVRGEGLNAWTQQTWFQWRE